MLLAEPCDWNDWRVEPASRLSVWEEGDSGWRLIGTIGPWSPPGIMWEVPVLIDDGTSQHLIISTIDRRHGNAQCSVRVWPGRYDGRTFVPDEPEGDLLDYGPDFYAACFSTQRNWPLDARVMVAWASNWSTARTTAWPGDIGEGAITLPRNIECRERRIFQSPLPAARTLAQIERWEPGNTLALAFDDRFELGISPAGTVAAQRYKPVWQLSAPLELAIPTEILIFDDHGLLEIFFEAEGRTMTIFIGSAANELW